MKKSRSAQKGMCQEKTVEIDELSEEIIGKDLLETINFVEINIDVKCAKKMFSFRANNDGCKLETSLSLKSLLIMFLAIGGYIIKKFL